MTRSTPSTVGVYRNLHRNQFSVQQKGRVIDHVDEIALKNADFHVSQRGRRRVLREQRKNVHARIQGTPTPPIESANAALRRYTYDPYRFNQFVDAGSYEPIEHSEYCELSAQGIHCLPPRQPAIREIPTASIRLDPNRFQYKLSADDQGRTGSLAAVQAWNPVLAGIVLVWRDPADGETYAINGHNRIALAQDLGVDKIWGRYLVARSASEARAMGAIANIAEGHGTAIDAAQFIRDTDLTPAEMAAHGINLDSAIAQQALPLSRLTPELFDLVANGRLGVAQGAAIGKLPAPRQGQAAHMILRKRLGQAASEEMVALLMTAPVGQATQLDLFGTSNKMVLIAEKARLITAIRRRLAQEQRVLATAGRPSAVATLEAHGNALNAAENRVAANLAQAKLAQFDRLKLVVGPVSEALNQGAQRLASGQSLAMVERETCGTICSLLDIS